MIRTAISFVLAGMFTGMGILTAAAMVFCSVALWLGGTFAHALIANSEGNGYTPTIWLLLPLAIHLAVTAVAATAAVAAVTPFLWFLRNHLYIVFVIMTLTVNLTILLVLLLPTVLLVFGSFVAG